MNIVPILVLLLTALVTSAIGFGWLLPRLPGISETGKRLGRLVLSALQAGIASAVVILMGTLAASCFTEGLGCVSIPGAQNNDERYGYVDKTGRLVIPAKFAYAKPFSEGLAVAGTPAP